MRPVGILLVGMPKMVCDLIERIIADETDMEIVGEAAADESLAKRVAATGAEMVIVGQQDHEIPRACRDLLAERSHLQVLGLSIDIWHGTVHELRPHRKSVGEIFPDTLVPVIRELRELARG